MPMQRFLWDRAPRFGIYHVDWPAIRHDSFVIITGCEAALVANPPGRFIGGAKPVLVGSIAPQNGFVEFTMWWTLIDVAYLNIWTDVIVL